jgi:hypothetical protein
MERLASAGPADGRVRTEADGPLPEAPGRRAPDGLRRRLHIAALLAACGLLQACIPAAPTYHRPTAPGGARISESCPTIVGPRQTIRFQYGAVELRAEGGETSLNLRFLLPEGHTVVLTDQRVRLARGGATFERPLSATPVPALRDPMRVSVRDTLVGATEKALFVRLPKTVSMWVEVSGPPATEYVVTLPPLVIDGRAVEVPPITFQRRRGFGLFLVNC